MSTVLINMSDEEDWLPELEENPSVEEDSDMADGPDLTPAVPQPSTSNATHGTQSASVLPHVPVEDSTGQVRERGRKRPRNEQNWAQNKRKLCRNRGQCYITANNATVPSKTFKHNLNCHCPRKCPQLFNSEKDVENFFKSFWKLGDFYKQNVFLKGVIQTSKVQRSRPRDGSSTLKSKIHQYFIPAKDENVRVCKKYFLGVLQISWGRVFRCLNKEEVFGVIDFRGKGPSNKIDDTDVIAHIKSFPAYQSHYTRRDNINKKYLHPDLNIKKMYNLYMEKCATENKVPVKEKYYYHVFSSKFNLHFKVPSKDTCKLCDELYQKIKIEHDEAAKKILLAERELHLRKAERAREALKEDKDSVSKDKYVCTFDLQKVLPFPKLTTSTAYYKRNLYIYNFSIHCFNDKTGYMYVWDKTEGGRGSEDLASCVQKHIHTNANSFKHVIFYSDSCTGQNRNIKMALTMLKLVQEPKLQVETIDFKFMVSGHSFLPNDTDFGVIERESRKHQFIYGPNVWYEIIESAKKKEPKFKVERMNRTEFLSTLTLEKSITNRKKDNENNKLNWMKMCWLRFQRDSPWEIKFKENLNDISQFRTIDLEKKKEVGRPSAALYDEWLSISVQVKHSIILTHVRSKLDLY